MARKAFEINKLRKIAVVGVGLLGGSIGLALRANGYQGHRVGIGRRSSSLRRALACEAVDETTRDPATGVRDAELVILCTPISRFEPLIEQMAPGLAAGCVVTDVGSTKAEVVRLADRLLPERVRFVGSHPMAGSEKTGVEYARADLFENALCIVTPSKQTPPATTRWVRRFWESIGGRSVVVDPDTHDKNLARVSHLPHAVATALVSLASRTSSIDLAGPGFADTTRIASGDPGMWTDVFRTNRTSMMRAIDQLVRELQRFRRNLERDDADALYHWLLENKRVRDQWIQRGYKKKVLTP